MPSSWAWERASADTAVNTQMSEKYKYKSISLESTDQTSLGWDARWEQGQPPIWLSGDIAGTRLASWSLGRRLL